MSAGTAGFFAGSFYQHSKTGYRFIPIDEREIEFAPNALLRLQHAFKKAGVPFMTPETSILTLEAFGSAKITIYEAQCGFQEAYPYVKDVTIDGHEVSWQDGKYNYHLRIDLLTSKSGHPRRDQD